MSIEEKTEEKYQTALDKDIDNGMGFLAKKAGNVLGTMYLIVNYFCKKLIDEPRQRKEIRNQYESVLLRRVGRK